MSEERRRLTASEQQALIEFMALVDRVELILKKKTLDKRMGEFPRMTAQVKQARTILLNTTEKLLDTVPVEQLKHMLRNLKHLCCHIYIGNTAATNVKKTEGRWFDLNEMNLFATAIKHVCADCPFDNAQDQRKCEFKKLLDCLPVDPDESGSLCGWFTRLGRE